MFGVFRLGIFVLCKRYIEKVLFIWKEMSRGSRVGGGGFGFEF